MRDLYMEIPATLDNKAATGAQSELLDSTPLPDSKNDAEEDAEEDEEEEEEVSMDVWMGTDPFYDRFPWFRLVGRFVFPLFLNSLNRFQSVRLSQQFDEQPNARSQSCDC